MQQISIRLRSIGFTKSAKASHYLCEGHGEGGQVATNFSPFEEHRVGGGVFDENGLKFVALDKVLRKMQPYSVFDN